MTPSRIAIGLLCAALAPAWPATAEPQASAAPAEDAAGGERGLPPVDLVLRLRHARLRTLEGDTVGALAALREAATAYPEAMLPAVALLDHARAHELPPEEAERLRRFLAERLADPELALPPETLDYLVGAGAPGPEELALLRQAVAQRMQKAPDDLRLLEVLAALDVRLGRPDEARRALGRLLELRPTPELLWDCIAMDYTAERWGDAIALLQGVVERPDAPAGARLLHLDLLSKAGRFEELLRRLESFDPSAAQGVVPRGPLVGLILEAAWALRDAGQGALAEATFRRVLAWDPDNVSARAAILHLYSSAEERSAHAERLRESWAREEDPHLLAEEGSKLLASGDARGAFELLERATAGLPESELAWFNLGLAALRIERPADAERATARAIALEPSRAEARLHRGTALQQLKRCEEAIAELEAALELRPELTQAHYYLYVCHRDLGHAEQAARHLAAYERPK